MNAIEVVKLCFSYQKDTPIIKDVSFTIKQGEYIVIVGGNGSGKSTLAKLLTGINKPQSGDVIIDGVKMVDKYVNPVSIVFQNPDNQFIATTVEEDIAFGLENQCMEMAKMQEKVREFAEKVHMLEYLSFEPSHLSGGQKQRVALAGVLVLDNDILILDEATSMLDPKGRNEVNQLIDELKSDNPKLTVLSITHDMNTILSADRLMVMKQGEILCFDKPEIVFKQKDPYIEEFFPLIYKIKNLLNNQGCAIKAMDQKGIISEICRLK